MQDYEALKDPLVLDHRQVSTTVTADLQQDQETGEKEMSRKRTKCPPGGLSSAGTFFDLQLQGIMSTSPESST
jgi:hypothetical protein